MRNAMIHAHIGLGPDPVATPTATASIKCAVVQLPYMGPHKFDNLVKSPYPTEELRLKSYQEKEMGSIESRPPEFTDPCELLIQKVAALSRILKCSEADAQHALFTSM